MTEKLTERDKLLQHFEDKLEVANHLNRKVVSFQANKTEPFYRWFKYKEGFSSTLVKYFLEEYSKKPGKVLDPFAGAGTTLFAGQEMGWEAVGIELLPVGVFAIEVREAINHIDLSKLKTVIKNIWTKLKSDKDVFIHHIPITKDAFPDETEELLNQYLSYCKSLKDKHIQTVLRFAAFTILEEISYTRKDGQYLRWDYRSKRNLSGKPFDKGNIVPFKDALSKKLNDIVADLSGQRDITLFDSLASNLPPIQTYQQSCLEQLPLLESNDFDFIITSPPYCNRYDYTRTYALELVFLGCDNSKVKDLRQAMLSCTVENKEKIDYLRNYYSGLDKVKDFEKVISAYNNSASMNEVINFLEHFRETGKLNNNGIARMVKNYFLELCFVIFEMARVLKKGGRTVMVNDNVRYVGEEVPVDLILSEFAESFGMQVEKIFVLPKGKGNSSQQMGAHGRTEVRKCVYLWRKNK